LGIDVLPGAEGVESGDGKVGGKIARTPISPLRRPNDESFRAVGAYKVNEEEITKPPAMFTASVFNRLTNSFFATNIPTDHIPKPTPI